MSAHARRVRIGKPCVRCGRRTEGASFCPEHAAELFAERDRRQTYREAYRSPEYRRARRAVFRRAAGRCEHVDGYGNRCDEPAVEAHHVVPLSSATTIEEAVALCTAANLAAVCYRHNPRGARPKSR
jgi:5-methylcytosine-specific restriction endonuclease McrA